jgi:hypothetical protein
MVSDEEKEASYIKRRATPKKKKRGKGKKEIIKKCAASKNRSSFFPVFHLSLVTSPIELVDVVDTEISFTKSNIC